MVTLLLGSDGDFNLSERFSNNAVIVKSPALCDHRVVVITGGGWQGLAGQTDGLYARGGECETERERK